MCSSLLLEIPAAATTATSTKVTTSASAEISACTTSKISSSAAEISACATAEVSSAKVTTGIVTLIAALFTGLTLTSFFS
jgi:hypothetical protein